MNSVEILEERMQTEKFLSSDSQTIACIVSPVE